MSDLALVLPPALVGRVCDLLGDDRDRWEKVLTPFWSDPEYQERIIAILDRLEPTVFDRATPAWGIWPINIEECALVGLFLGARLAGQLEEVAGADADAHALVESLIDAKSRASRRSDSSRRDV
jgi:hypothetical protein